MEHLEDKIIRNKIDSLDSLPAGYQPSLAGKWELLESALPERKNNKRYIFAIAASLLLLLGFSIIFYKFSATESTEILAQKPAIVNVKPAEKKGKFLPGKKQHNKEIADQEPTEKQHYKTTEKSHIYQAPNIVTAQDSTTQIIGEEPVTENKNLAAQTNLPAKKSKKRFVEIDFNNATQMQPKQEQKFAENKVKFKISILKNKSKVTNESSQPTVLKLSKEFPLNN